MLGLGMVWFTVWITIGMASLDVGNTGVDSTHNNMFVRVCKKAARRRITKSCENHVCFCHNGQWVCQFEKCSDNVELTGFFSLACCQPGDDSYKKDSCNWCHCFGAKGTLGRWFCENKECEISCDPITLAECKDGETLSLLCHDCICSSKRWDCIFKEKCRIDPLEMNYLALEVCDEGDKHRFDACDNFCECHHGQWYCLKPHCDKPQIEQVISIPECEKGSTKQSWCHTCHCYGSAESDKGIWFCETYNCDAERYLKSTNRDKLSLQIILDTKCETGAKVLLDCHRCTCHADEWKCKEKKYCRMESNTNLMSQADQDWDCEVRLTSTLDCQRCSKYNADGWKCRLKKECRYNPKKRNPNRSISALKCLLALRK